MSLPRTKYTYVRLLPLYCSEYLYDGVVSCNICEIFPCPFFCLSVCLSARSIPINYAKNEEEEKKEDMISFVYYEHELT